MRSCAASPGAAHSRLTEKGKSMDRKRSQHWSRILVSAAFALAIASGARRGHHDHPEHVVDDRPRGPTPRSIASSAYGDSIYAGYRGSLSNVAKRAAPWVDGEYLSTALERRHRGDPAHQVGRRRLRHLQQQDRRRALVHAEREHPHRHLRDVRQRRPAGAQQLRRAERHLQLRAARTPRSRTARPTRSGDELHQRNATAATRK